MVLETGVRKMCHSSRGQFWHPSRVRFSFDGVPGVSLTLNPRLMSGSPSGCPRRLKRPKGSVRTELTSPSVPPLNAGICLARYRSAELYSELYRRVALCEALGNSGAWYRSYAP